MAEDTSPAGFVEEHPGLLWLAVVTVPLVSLAVGVLVAPELVYDRFLWKHIIGPSVADAHQAPTATYNGVVAQAGYTLVSEAVYGLTLVVLLYGIYTFLLRRFRIETKGRFLLALLPLVMLGPLSRSLEDANVFLTAGDPSFLAFAFISPWIYFQIGFYAVMFLTIGLLVEQTARLHGYPDSGEGESILMALVVAPLGFIVAMYGFLTTAYGAELQAVASPIWVALAALVGLGIHLRTLQKGDPNLYAVTFALGLPLVTPSIVLVGRWILQEPWAGDPTIFIGAGATMLAFALGTTLLVYLVGRFLGTDAPRLRHYAKPINLAMVLAHMIDGWTTYIAIEDPFAFGLGGYGEKHPVSEYFLGFGDGLGFPVLKLLMVLVIIYLLDEGLEEPDNELTPEEEEVEENMVGLVKFAIFVLGFAPGLRGVARVVMGV